MVMAYEFIMLATPATQQKPLEELRRTIVDWAPGLRDKQAFWKRRTSIVKVDMLLMAYFARLPVPAELRADLRYVLTKSPFFLEEMLKIANIPRVYGWPFGWLAPTVGALETLQCLSVALTPSARRPPPGGAAASASAGGGFFLDAALLALPGVDIDAAKRLARHRKIRTLTDLLLLGGAEERRLALVEAGLVDGDGSPPSKGLPAPGTVAAVEAAILALPDLAIAKAKAGLGDFDSDDESDADDDGDDVPRPGDVVTVSCRALLSRRCHTATPDARAPRGKVLPFAPYLPGGLPVTRHERWWVVVGDAGSNTCFAVKRVDLRAAEGAAFEARKAGAAGLGGDAEVLAFVESRMIGKTNPEAGASAEVKAAAGGAKKGSPGAPAAPPPPSHVAFLARRIYHRYPRTATTTTTTNTTTTDDDIRIVLDTSAHVAIGMAVEEALTSALAPLAAAHVERCRALEREAPGGEGVDGMGGGRNNNVEGGGGVESAVGDDCLATR